MSPRWTGFDEANIVEALLRATGHTTAHQKELAA